MLKVEGLNPGASVYVSVFSDLLAVAFWARIYLRVLVIVDSNHTEVEIKISILILIDGGC